MSNALAEIDNTANELFSTLKTIGNGDLINEIASSMEAATTSSQHTMKRSKVTIEVIIEPDTKSDAFRVWGTVKAKLPPEPTKASLFFPSMGKLTRIDPRQRDMFQNEIK